MAFHEQVEWLADSASIAVTGPMDSHCKILNTKLQLVLQLSEVVDVT